MIITENKTIEFINSLKAASSNSFLKYVSGLKLMKEILFNEFKYFEQKFKNLF